MSATPRALSSIELNRAGAALFAQGAFGEAEDAFLQAIAEDGANAEAWSNLGFVYQTNGLRDDAMRCYLKANALSPEQPLTLTNLGYLTQEDGHDEAAIALFERALKLDPKLALARANLGISQLLGRDFAAGWPNWMAHYALEPHPVFPQPVWGGEPCQRVALWHEQGIGDHILFGTLLPELEARGQAYVCELDPRLIPAFQRSFPRAKFVARRPAVVTINAIGGTEGNYSDTEFAACDFQLPMGGLATLFRTSEESFLAQPKRLLHADTALAQEAGRRVREFARNGEVVVGISWRSFLPHRGRFVEKKKSGSLEMFAPLAERGGLALVNLQYGNIYEELGHFREDHRILNFPDWDLFYDMERVIALAAACDVIVTTCCVTAHVAGALGKPCYVMYLRERPPIMTWVPNERRRSYWYPSCRIVTASDMNEWSQAIGEVATALG